MEHVWEYYFEFLNFLISTYEVAVNQSSENTKINNVLVLIPQYFSDFRTPSEAPRSLVSTGRHN